MTAIGIGIRPTLGSFNWTSLQKFDFFVDSVNGSDANHGQSPAEAFKTLSALTPFLANNVRIGLARGSEWREQLDTSAYTGVVIGAYGTGALPVVRADDVVTDWSKTDGYTNVYERTWTPLGALGKNTPTIYEDGVILYRVNSLALCDSTPGSFYASNSYTIDTPAPIYIHATGSGDPTSNGKTYEQATRQFAIKMGADSTISNVRTKRNLHNDGSLVVGLRARVSNCIFEDGTVHNCLIASGVMSNCTAWKADPRTRIFDGLSSTMFVAYSNSANSGAAVFNRCKAIMQAVGSHSVSGFYSHGQSANTFSRTYYSQCIAAYCFSGFDGGDSDDLTAEGCLAFQCGLGYVAKGTIPSTYRRCEYYTSIPGLFTYNAGWGNATSAISSAQPIMEDCVLAAANDCIRFHSSTGDAVARRLLMIAIGDTANTYGIRLASTGGVDASLSLSDSVMQGFGVVATKYFLANPDASGSTFTGSNNVYARPTGTAGRFMLNNVTYNTPDAWLAAVQPGNEVGSTFQTTTQFTSDPTNREYTLDASKAAYLQGCGPVGFTPLDFDYAALSAELAAA